MKKLIFSFVAVLLATIAFVAFRPQEQTATPKTTLSNVHVYEFTGDPTDPAEVADPSMWVYNASGSDCDALERPQACTILVDDAHKSTPTLADGSNITITADNDLGSGANYRVTEAKDGSYQATPSNKNP